MDRAGITSNVRTLINFKRVLVKLRAVYGAYASRWPRLQEYYAQKIADVELTIGAINNRLRSRSEPTTPGGKDG